MIIELNTIQKQGFNIYNYKFYLKKNLFLLKYKLFINIK